MCHWALGAIALITACGPKPDLAYKNLTVYYQGLPRIDSQVECIYDATNREATALDTAWDGMVAAVTFEPGSFHCSSDPDPADWYAGCQPVWGGSSFEVQYEDPLIDSALAWELAHFVWERLYNDSGETRPDGGFYSIVGEPDFNAFVERVNVDCMAKP